MLFRKRRTRFYFIKNFTTLVGLVMIWRGLWYVLDGVDQWLFGGVHTWTAIGGIILGLLILYLPDKDLKEIEKL